ncbi:uncharacterized protein LOC117615606 [Prunus dulcis]|uniref:uncharacterized protein LOC117615606 n=1 Tax=Prunus dulcis TaxID=3755 RepID=UPI0014830B1D|nr:uncharacterized protein LOC117615606 [Prunus dulcis]
MEVYVDDMLVKAPKRADHIKNLAEAFSLLCQYRMKLNPNKCTFGVSSGRFLGYLVTQRGIEAHPRQIKAILEMKSPSTVKEIQSLTGRAATLNRFLSRSTDKCRPFFETLKKGQRDKSDEECEVAFHNLKTYLTSPPLLSKPTPGEDLFVYLAVFNSAQKAAINAQALANFVAEFTPSAEEEKLVNKKKESLKANGMSVEPSQPRDMWQLRINGASNQKEAGAGVVITTPDGTVLEQAITLGFLASNNEAEYEALLSSLRLAKELAIKKLAIYSDSQLITNQASGEYMAKHPRMILYLDKVQELLKAFPTFTIQQVRRAENAHVDPLASLGSALDTQFRRSILIEHLDRPSIKEIEPIDTIKIDEDPSWQDPIIDYLVNENLPADKSEARKVQQKAA